jgi:hypothetical protein
LIRFARLSSAFLQSGNKVADRDMKSPRSLFCARDWGDFAIIQPR